MIRAALIDLDGTLLDTAPDLAAAANRMLEALGRAPRPAAEVATYVGKGLARLVERCLTGDLEAKPDPALMERAYPAFSLAYEEESGRHSHVYPGVREGLRTLSGQGLRLGCVTNKAARFAHPLLRKMALHESFDAIVCGDEVARAKPDPMSYLLACERLGVAPAQAIVIGDSGNDVAAARAAGIRVLCVPYGYSEGRPVESLGADAIVAGLVEACAFIADLNGRAASR